MSTATRRRILDQAGLLHPRPEAVSAPLFDGREPFFLALDKVQVKYEMLRVHVLDGLSASAVAEQHGYSRAAFYLITAAFDEAGMLGLLDEPRGRRGPLKLTPQVLEFLASADRSLSGAQLVAQVERRFGLRLHRRTIDSRIRTGFGPENITRLRRFAVGILKSFQKPSQSIAELMRRLCFRNRLVFDYLRMTKNSAHLPSPA